MNQSLFVSSLIFLFIDQNFCSYEELLANLAQKHYEKFDCLEKTAQPFEISQEIVVSECWRKCFTKSECFAFEYCDLSKACKLFDSKRIGFNFHSITSDTCKKEYSFGFSELYIIKRIENGQTIDCEGIKSRNHSAENGYFDIIIRGIVVRAYCIMSTTTAKTYIDVEGVSVWGGSNKQRRHPWFQVIRTWTKVQIQIRSCMILVIGDDFTFSELSPNFPETYKQLYFGYGANCERNAFEFPAEMKINLSATSFFIPDSIEFRVKGWNKKTIFNHFDTNRQIVHVAGTGYCGFIKTIHLKSRKSFTKRIPLLMTHR